MEDVSFGLGAPRPGPTEDFLPGDPNNSPAVTVRVGLRIGTWVRVLRRRSICHTRMRVRIAKGEKSGFRGKSVKLGREIGVVRL